MSFPSVPPSGSGTRTTTIVVAVLLVMVLVIAGVGVGGFAVWALLSDRGGSGTSATTPVPSEDAGQATAYPPELEQYYEQDLNWQGCGGDECARLTVPLDYDAADGETIELAVLRARATSRDQRVGQLVVNPGGPGGSGVQYAKSGASSFGEEVTRYFDIVGFDPRGVGDSTPLECFGTRQTDELLSADPDPDTPAEVAELDRLTRELGEACLANSGELARHVSTDDVARDMDVLRAALGERLLDYFGASYGTLVGATYADLFPTNVRRMVLDGAVDPSLSNEELTLGQARGFETALRAYLRDCVRKSCVLGSTVEEGSKRIVRLLEDLDARPLPTSTDRELTEGLALYGIILPLYVEDYWPLLSAALRQALNGQGDALLSLADAYSSRGPDGYTDNSIEALYAVNCLDHPDSVPSSEVPSRIEEFEKASPTFGRIFAYSISSCASWPVESDGGTSAMDAAGAPPILVVGTTRDPATPYEQAVALAEQLESGVLVSRDGDGHTGFQQGNECVDGAIEDYLIGGKVPTDGLSC